MRRRQEWLSSGRFASARCRDSGAGSGLGFDPGPGAAHYRRIDTRMKTKPQLKTAMTPFPYAVDVRESVSEAKALMEVHGVRHLPVTRDHELVGVLSERDLLHARPGDAQVQDIYSADPYIADLEEPIDNVLETMAERHIGCALITRKGNLAGVFTNTDACRCFAAHLRALFPEPGDDDAA